MTRAAPRLAIIGAGWIARLGYRSHLQQRTTLSAVRVYDRDPSSAAELAAGLPGCEVADTLDQCFGPEVDALLVCTPPSEHLEVLLRARAAGKYVLCEKPVVRSETEGISALANGERLMGSATMRFRRDLGELLEWVRTGCVGQVRRVGLRWVRHRGVPVPGSWRTCRRVSPGGVLEDLGPHLLDLAAAGLGAASGGLSVREATLERRDGRGAMASHMFDGSLARGYDAPDYCRATIANDDGVEVDLELAWIDPTEGDEVQVSFEGTGGVARFSGLLGLSRSRRSAVQCCELNGASGQLERHYPTGPGEQMLAFRRSLDHFAGFCRGEVAPRASATEIAHVARWIGAIQESAHRREVA